jgi:alcohol dehydrogenase YqhD (iron-dependent ADH family)
MLSSAKSLEICSKSKLDGILEDYYPSVVDSARRYLSNSFYLENPWDID